MTRPELATARFELWRPRADDLPDMVELLGPPEIRRFLGSAEPGPKAQFERLMRHAGGWALYGYGNFYVRPRGQEKIIGNCGIFRSWRGLPGLDDVPEAGWIVHRDWWGKGVAGEVMAAAFDWFDRVHGTQRIGCMIEEGNIGSEKLAAHFGFAEYHRHAGEDGKVVVLYERT